MKHNAFFPVDEGLHDAIRGFRILRCVVLPAVFLGLLSALPVTARDWEEGPQPLVAGNRYDRYECVADPRSPLAFESSWKVLFFAKAGVLSGYYWTGSYFERANFESPQTLKPESAIVWDEAWHQAYFIGSDDRLKVARRSGKKSAPWKTSIVLDEPITEVLGVDERWHVVYAYSEARQAILSVRWTGAQWKSEAIAEQIGAPGGQGVVDSKSHVLYSTHSDFTGSLPPLQQTEIAPPLAGWPLVATWWNGKVWQSRVVARTGVPQRPAWDSRNSRLYFSNWQTPGTASCIELSQPLKSLASAKVLSPFQTLDKSALVLRKAGVDIAKAGTAPFATGNKTWKDDQSYWINYNEADLYASGFYGSTWLQLTSVFSNNTFSNYPPPTFSPWEKVTCYVPDWQATPLPARVSSWSAVVSERRGELVHQEGSHAGGTLLTAPAWREVPDVYGHRDASGNFTIFFRWAAEWADEVPANRLDLTTLVEGKRLPTGQAAAWDAYKNFGTKAGAYFSPKLAMVTSTDVVTDPSAPLPPPRLAGANSGLRTFGLPLAKASSNPKPGGRFMDYSPAAANRCWSGGIACDRRSPFVFYTQAPQVTVTPTKGGGGFPPFGGNIDVEFDAFAENPAVVSERPVWISVIF